MPGCVYATPMSRPPGQNTSLHLETIDTLISARWLVPGVPHGTVLEHASVAVLDGAIHAVLPTDAALTRFDAREHIVLGEHVLTPGLINSHTHAAMTLMRGMADDQPLMIWLEQHIWPTEARFVCEAYVRDGTRAAVAEMLRAGVTCFADMYFYPEISAQVAAEAGMRTLAGLIVIDFPTVWASNADEYIAKGLALYDEFKDEPLVECAFAPHAPYTVSDGPLSRIRTLADELDIPIHTHVHETSDEVSRSIAEHGKRPLARLDDLGLLSPRLIAVHMNHLEDTEIEQVARANASVVHCPESNLKLASGFCPVTKLMDAGVNVAIGTDGTASNNDLSVLGDTRTASLLAKGLAADATVLPAAQALHMATLAGAQALGMADRIGSIEEGKRADLTAVDLSALETQPVFDPISQLIYAASSRQVSDVWVDGQRRLADGALTSLDLEEVTANVTAWGVRMREVSE